MDTGLIKKESYYLGFQPLHGEVSIYIWFMCLSTCQVEFVFREMSFFILLPRRRLIGCSGDFSVLKRTVMLINYYPGGWYRNRLGLLL